jgi:predicted flap endonuclease-1-like 5' DNA nuclease
VVVEAPQPKLVKPKPAPIAVAPKMKSKPQPISNALDLSVLPNLGPAMRQRLNQLGLYTIADMASINPDGLRNLLGSISVLANVDQWVADANALLSEQKRAA